MGKEEDSAEEWERLEDEEAGLKMNETRKKKIKFDQKRLEKSDQR